MPTSVAPSGLAHVTGLSTGEARHLEALGQRIRDLHLRPYPLLGRRRHSRIRAAYCRQKLTTTPIDVPCVYGEK
jgi:hypothetical protein